MRLLKWSQFTYYLLAPSSSRADSPRSRHRAERHGVLREFHGRGRLRFHVASLLHERGLGSIFEWFMGLLLGSGLLMGVAVSVGMDAVSLRKLVVLSGHGMGMATRWRMEWLEQWHRTDSKRRAGALSATAGPGPPTGRIDSDAGEPKAPGAIGTGLA